MYTITAWILVRIDCVWTNGDVDAYFYSISQITGKEVNKMLLSLIKLANSFAH